MNLLFSRCSQKKRSFYIEQSRLLCIVATGMIRELTKKNKKKKTEETSRNWSCWQVWCQRILFPSARDEPNSLDTVRSRQSRKQRRSSRGKQLMPGKVHPREDNVHKWTKPRFFSLFFFPLICSRRDQPHRVFTNKLKFKTLWTYIILYNRKIKKKKFFSVSLYLFFFLNLLSLIASFIFSYVRNPGFWYKALSDGNCLMISSRSARLL